MKVEIVLNGVVQSGIVVGTSCDKVMVRIDDKKIVFIASDLL